MSWHGSQRLRRCLGWIAALGLLVSSTGCGLPGDRRSAIRAAGVARALTATSGIALSATPPPRGVRGLPQLETTLSGESGSEWLTALVFFQRDGAARFVGRAHSLPGATVLRRENVVVIYHPSPGVKDQSAELRRALTRLRSMG